MLTHIRGVPGHRQDCCCTSTAVRPLLESHALWCMIELLGVQLKPGLEEDAWKQLFIEIQKCHLMISDGGKWWRGGELKGKEQAKERWECQSASLLRTLLSILLLFCDRPAPFILLFAVGFAWRCTQDRQRLWVVCLLFIFVQKSWFAKLADVTRGEIKLTLFAFSEFFHGQEYICELT